MPMPLSRLLPTLLAFASLGCVAVHAPLTCPERGGARWTEVTSAHLILRTDTEPPDARALVAEFERLYDALAYVTQRPASAAARIEIIRFERRKDFHEIVGRDPTVKAYFTASAPGDLEPQPTLVLSGEDMADDARETFLHELTHRFLHERFAALPVWLDEGLAQYYATLRIVEGRVVLGAPGDRDFSDRALFWESWRGSSSTLQIPRSKAPTVWKLIDADRAEFYALRGRSDPTDPSNEERDRQTANYGAAWKLVHYFLNGPDADDRARFAAFLAAVQRGERGRNAFLETFGRDLPRLERAFSRYLTEARLSRRVAEPPTAFAAAPATSRVMSDAEIHLLWARLSPWKKGSMEQVYRELDEALTHDLGSPEVRYQRAIFFMHQEQLDDAWRELSAALTARPDDPRYLYAQILWLERAAASKAERPSLPPELMERLARKATSATELVAVALYTRQTGRTEDAFRFIDRAVALDPLCWQCQKVRAILLADTGQLDEALALLDHVVMLSPEGASVDGIVALRRRIEQARAAELPSR